MKRLCLVVLLACAACGASAEVKTVRDPHYVGQMKKLHVVISQGEIDEDFALELDKSLRREFSHRGVAYSSRILGGLELDRAIVLRDVSSLHPDGALMLTPVRGTTYYGEIILLTYDVRLLETAKGDVVWRGRVDSKRAAGAYGTVAGMMEVTATGIADKIQADGFLARE